MTQTLKHIIVENVRRLIEYEYKDAQKRPSQAYIGNKIGISQRSVSYLFDDNSTVDSIRSDTIELIASYYGLEPYHLMIPNLPIEELTNRRIEKVIECYTQVSIESRENIARIAENEMRYSPNTNYKKTINGDQMTSGKIIFLLAATLTGCATYMHGSTQTVKIETRNNNKSDTRCTVNNEEGTWTDIIPNRGIEIARDGNRLNVTCTNSLQNGTSFADPEFSTTELLVDLLVIDTCLISCIVDGVNNAFYTYPDPIIVRMTTISE